MKTRLSRSPARTPQVWAGTVVRVLRPRTRAVHALVAHQPVNGVRADVREAVASQPGGHLATAEQHLGSWPPVVAGPDVQQHVPQRRIAAVPGARVAGLPSSVGAWGDRQAKLGELVADRLDPTSKTSLRVDERADQRRRGSSSPAKNIEAAFKISLASVRSRTCDFRALISASSSLEGPGLSPPSTWACTIYFRNVSGPTPSFGPRTSAAAHGEEQSSKRSRAIRKARPR